MKKICDSKRGQMELSFGMIFSIILIIVFVAFAIYAITKFLVLADTTKIGKFKMELQEDVDNFWGGSGGVQNYSYLLPSKVDYVCFVDFTKTAKGTDTSMYSELKEEYNMRNENVVLYPVKEFGKVNSFLIEHLDIQKTTEKNNPLCLENKNGRTKLVLRKGYSERTVTIEK